MANYKENTKAQLPHIGQTYSSPFDDHPIFGNIGGWVVDPTTASLKYKLNKLNWDKKADGTPSNLDGSDGDVMVKIPAFFFKVIRQANGKPRFEIDDTIPDLYGSNGKIGFRVHPAFVKANGQVRPYFLWGAYKGTVVDNKLRSVSGVIPQGSKTKGAFQDAARQGRTVDYGIVSAYERWAVQLLFYAEFGSLDSKSSCGRGIIDLGSTGDTTDKNLRITGQSNSLGDRSGYVDLGNGNGKSSVRYRGIEDLWGNIWEFLAGVMVTDKGWYYTNEHSKMDIIPQMSLYTKDLTAKVADGYITDMEYPVGLEWTFIPKTTGGSSTTYYCDYFWTHDSGEENIALVGGDWGNGSHAGLACWPCHHVASYVHAGFGARLSYAQQ